MNEKIQWLIANHVLVAGYAAEILAGLTVAHHAANSAVDKMKAYAATTPSGSDDAAIGFIASALFYFGVVLDTVSSILPVGAIRIGKKK